jgi:hypothetical protein
MDHERTVEAVASGSAIEAIGGLGAIVLATIGLASVYPVLLAAIATIVIGGALLLEGAAIAARYSRMALERGDTAEQTEVSSGLSAEFMGGVAGVVLGVLALVGVHSTVLIPVAALVFGASLLIGSAANARLNQMIVLAPRHDQDDYMRRVAKETVNAASGAEFLVGAGATVLGILAIVGAGPWLSLSLVALLAVGTAVLLTGTAVSGKLLSFLRH